MLVTSSFLEVLYAEAPDPERASKLALYAWIIGDWDGRDDNTRRWHDAPRLGGDSRRLGAPGSGDSERLDDPAPARPQAGNRAVVRRRQLVRDDLAYLRHRAR